MLAGNDAYRALKALAKLHDMTDDAEHVTMHVLVHNLVYSITKSPNQQRDHEILAGYREKDESNV